MARKQEFAVSFRSRISEFDDLYRKLVELKDIYDASGYGSGGDNEITVEDLAALDMTPQMLSQIGYFVEQLTLFLNNGDPAVVDYAEYINKLRTMP